jgi:hypothetical protein
MSVKSFGERSDRETQFRGALPAADKGASKMRVCESGSIFLQGEAVSFI